VEIGLGEKLLVAAIAAAYGKSEAVVTRGLRGKGDLGAVAESLAPPVKRKRLSLREGYDGLLDVARTGGSGSIERKVARFAELLRRAGPVEAKLLVRVAQGRLRLGLGDQSILDAAALAALGDRREKALLEHAYNVRSDLGEVVAIAFAKGKRALEGVGPEVGVPVRPALAQRLASAEEIVRRLGTVQLEPKFDGLRLQLHRDGKRVTIFSRRLENVTGMFPELVDGLLRQLKHTRAILEGEAVVYDTATGAFLPFQVTMTRKRKTKIEEMSKSHPLRLFAFDVLRLGATNLIPRTQEERSRRLREALPFEAGDAVEVTETRTASRASEIDDFFADSMEKGYEGLIAKRLDAPYQPGARGYHWVKLKRAYSAKLRDTVDLVLVGYIRGRGKRAAFGIGSLLGVSTS
jgi:DNA ligase-1